MKLSVTIMHTVRFIIFGSLLLLNLRQVILQFDTWTNISHFVPCIVNITSNYKRKTDFFFLSSELKYMEPNDEIIYYMRYPVVIQQVQQYTGRFGFFLLFPEPGKSYESLFKIIQPSVYNKFLVVCPYREATTGVIELINQFWSFRLLDVFILCRISTDAIHVYSYNPYLEPYCNTPSLVQVNIWSNLQKEFIYTSDFYTWSEKILINLNGCPLICFAKNRPPDALVRKVNNEWELGGVGGHFMKEVGKRFNFTSLIEVPKMNVTIDKYGYDISSGFPELVSARLTNHSVDLAFGIYSHIIYDNPETEFPAASVSECYGWAVPAHMGRTIPTWMYYTQEFNILVWFAILLMYLASVTILYMYSQFYYHPASVFRSSTFVTFYTFSLLLGVSATPRVILTRIRIIITLIVLYSLVISSAYTSSLGSFLTVPWKRENIKSFQEIVDADYLIHGSPQTKRILQRLAKGVSALEELSTRFRTHKNHFDSLILRMQRKKDISTFAAQRFLQFYISNALNSTDKEDVYLLPECVIQAHASPFLFKKGSPFINPVNRIILTAVEAGLTQFWFTYSTPKIAVSRFTKIQPLSLRQLTFVFIILLIGFFLSIVAFIIELYSRRKQKSTEKGKIGVRRTNRMLRRHNLFITRRR